ncbi:hypothetical protein HBB16_14770 [Pseudonocardia sp. MCCB 268]|nr:hypothetical protein [Pseudonocardia cytotoxica]
MRRHVGDACHPGGRAIVGGADSVRDDSRIDPVVIADVPVGRRHRGDVRPAAGREPGPGRRRGVPPGQHHRATASAPRCSLRQHWREIAEQLRCGMVSINGVISFAGSRRCRSAVWASRFRPDPRCRRIAVHRAQSIAGSGSRPPIVVTSFRRTKTMQALLGIVKVRHGRL